MPFTLPWKRQATKNSQVMEVSNATANQKLPRNGIDIVEVIDFKPCEDVDKVVTLLVIGAGMRGNTYSAYAGEFPKRAKVVGIAEPKDYRRNLFQKEYGIPEENVFTDWKEAASREKFADAVLICTLDTLHHEPVLVFADKGYHILCEKPMALEEKLCEEMVNAVTRNDVILALGHVMRYTPNIMKMKELIESNAIGKVMNIQHMEPVGWWHFAHSFVRGNWKKEEGDAGSLMAKSCHDIDIIKHLMGDSKCLKVQSFGNLTHFTKANMPDGASSRCLDCKVERDCPYSAVKTYLDPVKLGWPNGFCFVVADVPDIENITEALRNGPYGRCVYDSDNNVCDNQVVNMEFEGGVIASFTMVAFTEAMCKRRIKVFGTHGEIILEEGSKDCLTMYNFNTRKRTSYKASAPELNTMRGHGYGDYYLMRAFVSAVARNDPTLTSNGEDSLRGHRIVFAAERSRKRGGEMLQVNI